MGKGKGYGKVIFFGEHFAVYNLPAIAMAFSTTADAEVFQTDSRGWDIRDDRQKRKGYIEEKNDLVPTEWVKMSSLDHR